MNTEPDPLPPQEPIDPYHGGPVGAGIDWADPNSPLARFYLTTSGVFAVAILGLAFLLLSLFPLSHTDFWAHLKYGEWIVANREIPGIEPLGEFTDKQTRMFDAMWLSQVSYHALFEGGGAAAGGDERSRFEGGVEAVRLAHLFATVVALGLFGLACRRASGSIPWASGGMVFILVLMLSPLGVQRPQAFGITCYAAVLCVLSRDQPGRLSMFGLPLLMVLWANTHGSFVLGFGLIGVFLIGRAAGVGRAEGVKAAWRNPGVRVHLVALILGGIAVAFLNPYGPSIYLEVARFGSSPNLQTVVEWQPLDFSQPRGGHWGYLGTVVFLIVTQIASPRWFSVPQMLLIVTLGVWPLFQQRAMTWWIPIVVWIAAPHWVVAVQRWGMAREMGVASLRKTALAVVIALVLIIMSPASTWVKTGQPRPTTQAVYRGTPNDIADALMGRPAANPERVAALVRVVQDEHRKRFTGRVFASETQGDYLVWALPPDAPVMIFNHAQVFPSAFWTACLAVKAAAPGWERMLDRYLVKAVVVEIESSPALCDALRTSPNWKVVVDEANAPVRDPRARLFVAIRKNASGV